MRLLDKKVNGVYQFQYTPACETDIRKTFERARIAAPQVSTSQPSGTVAKLSEPAVAATESAPQAAESARTGAVHQAAPSPAEAVK